MKPLKWYALQVYTGHEDKVKADLETRAEQLGYGDLVKEVFVPTYTETKKTDQNKRRTVVKKLYPTYVFVNVRLEKEVWYLIRQTDSVMGILGNNGLGKPMKDSDIANIKRSVEVKQSTVSCDYAKGDEVRIKDGPAEGLSGTVQDISTAKQKLYILVNIFGNEHKVEADYDDVEKVK